MNRWLRRLFLFYVFWAFGMGPIVAGLLLESAEAMP